MAPNKFVKTCFLLPMSKLYGFGVWARNLMFKWRILKQHKFDVPVIVVGNIAAGGTGKTPHTEYILNLLKYNYRIGMVSRGYKRKTKGFVLATNHSTPLDIGDEPYQIYRKFGRDVAVAVCENRCEGIEKLLQIDPKINLIVLDDAFQHRYVEPTVSIVLTEFNSPLFNDRLLPLGRLREPQNAVLRADIVVVTKCPEHIKPIEVRIFQNGLKLWPYQHLFFSRYEYHRLKPVFPEEGASTSSFDWLTKKDTILLVSGVANPRPLVSQIKKMGAKVKVMLFPDHHYFSRKDLDAIAKRFAELPGDRKFIVTTEKDAVRMTNNPYFPQALKKYIFYQPINVVFDHLTTESFDIELRKLLTQAKEAAAAPDTKEAPH